MIKAAIFDMDGLLIDSEPLWWEAEIETFSEVSIVLDEVRARETTGYRIDEIVDYWYEQFPWRGPSKQQVQDRLMQRLIERIYKKGKPKEGVAHALRFCQEQGAKLALASSSVYAIIDVVLETLGLHNTFQVIHSAEDERYGKPHPAVFITTAQQLQVAPRQCVAFEDSLNGVLAAKAATMKCIAIPETFPAYDPKLIIADSILPSLTALQKNIWEELQL